MVMLVRRQVSCSVAVVVVLLGPLLLAACSDADDAERPGRTSTTRGDRITDGAFDPIDGMKASPDQAPISPADVVVILEAERRLVDRCMADEGFGDVTGFDLPYRAEAPPLLSPDELRSGGYRYDWAADAQEYLVLNGPDGPPDPMEGMSEERSKAYVDALDGGNAGEAVELQDVEGGTVGVSTGGCTGEARETLYGSLENSIRYGRAVERLGGAGLSEKLFARTEYRALATAWQECMEEAGHDVGSTKEASGTTIDGYDYGLQYLVARQAAQLSEGKGPLAQAEIDAVAAADATCQKSSGLDELRRELVPEARDEIADELGFEQDQYIAYQHALLERAKDVP
jgi:hypothetical protein